MADLISREEVKEELVAWARVIKNPKFLSREDTFVAIDAIPAVDAVEVVRCKDCKHAKTTKNEGTAIYCQLWNSGKMHAEFFCGAAIRDRREG